MLLTLNEARSSGTLPCDSGLRTRLVFDERLRCAARLHVLEMEDLDYHLVTSPDGITPGDRAESAGYPVNIWGGSISQAAFDSPQEFIAAVAEQYSTGGDTTNCTNIVDIDYKHVGVGYADGYFSIIYASGE